MVNIPASPMGMEYVKKKRRSEFPGRGANRGVAIFRSADYSLRK